MAREKTLVILKPDAVESGWSKEIIWIYQAAGLFVAARKTYFFDRAGAQEFYREHEGRPFFAGLYLAMASGACEALILEGENAVDMVRHLNGATNPKEAAKGTIRHHFKSAGGPYNVVHGSDSPKSAEREIALIFPKFEGERHGDA